MGGFIPRKYTTDMATVSPHVHNYFLQGCRLISSYIRQEYRIIIIIYKYIYNLGIYTSIIFYIVCICTRTFENYYSFLTKGIRERLLLCRIFEGVLPRLVKQKKPSQLHHQPFIIVHTDYGSNCSLLPRFRQERQCRRGR